MKQTEIAERQVWLYRYVPVALYLRPAFFSYSFGYFLRKNEVICKNFRIFVPIE